MRPAIKVAIGILLLILGIGYTMRRKIDRGRDPRLEPYSDLNVDDARLMAHLVAGSPPPPTDPATCINLVSYKRAAEDNRTNITGSVKNACDRHYRYVEVTFKLFNASGSVIGTALANQGSLEAGETWKFKAHGLMSAPKFQFDHIRAF